MSHDDNPVWALVPLVSDHTTPTASDLNPPIEVLADRAAWLRARLDLLLEPPVVALDPTTPTEWTAPELAARVRLRGCGGGGGGGGGAGGSNVADKSAQSGSGGGAPLERTVEVPVTPGTVYEIVIGNGGAGGAGGAPGVFGDPGAHGEDTIFREKVSGTVRATFKGARGGRGGLANRVRTGSPSTYQISAGGGPTKQDQLNVQTESLLTFVFGPGFGGDGVDGDVAQSTAGADSIEGFAGGLGKAKGAANGAVVGGGGGGGGAAGPYNFGAAGGLGGDAKVGVAGENGANGGLAFPNSGAGGGGGGGGGSSLTVGGGSGGNGGAGGSGRLALTVSGLEVP